MEVMPRREKRRRKTHFAQIYQQLPRAKFIFLCCFTYYNYFYTHVSYLANTNHSGEQHRHIMQNYYVSVGGKNEKKKDDNLENWMKLYLPKWWLGFHGAVGTVMTGRHTLCVMVCVCSVEAVLWTRVICTLLFLEMPQ